MFSRLIARNCSPLGRNAFTKLFSKHEPFNEIKCQAFSRQLHHHLRDSIKLFKTSSNLHSTHCQTNILSNIQQRLGLISHFATDSNLYQSVKKSEINEQQQQQSLNVKNDEVCSIVKKRRKKMIKKEVPLMDITAYSTSDEYHLDELAEGLKEQGLYEMVQLPDDMEDVIHVVAKYQLQDELREIYFFKEGSVVFWNVPLIERQLALKFLRSFETNSYEPEMVDQEKEEMDFDYVYNGKTRLTKGTIFINKSQEEPHLDKYAFSNAIAQSVKLAIWEASMDKYIDSIEYVTQDMKQGKKVKLTRDQVFRKTGELFALRHKINLSSDLLDVPDFYWNREELERIYINTCNFLNMTKRTKVMNEKLSNCQELMDLLSHHLNDNHHVRLEWMIIILIMVEVLFEFIHYAEKLL